MSVFMTEPFAWLNHSMVEDPPFPASRLNTKPLREEKVSLPPE